MLSDSEKIALRSLFSEPAISEYFHEKPFESWEAWQIHVKQFGECEPVTLTGHTTGKKFPWEAINDVPN